VVSWELLPNERGPQLDCGIPVTRPKSR